MARDRYENWDLLLQRWAIILKNCDDHEIKKDHGQVQANSANQREKVCFKCGRKGHVASDCKSKDDVKCEECGGEHLTEKHDAV